MFGDYIRDVPAVSETTTRGPVELEGSVRVRDQLAIEGECLGSGIGTAEVDKAVASVASGKVLV